MQPQRRRDQRVVTKRPVHLQQLTPVRVVNRFFIEQGGDRAGEITAERRQHIRDVTEHVLHAPVAVAEDRIRELGGQCLDRARFDAVARQRRDHGDDPVPLLAQPSQQAIDPILVAGPRRQRHHVRQAEHRRPVGALLDERPRAQLDLRWRDVDRRRRRRGGRRPTGRGVPALRSAAGEVVFERIHSGQANVFGLRQVVRPGRRPAMGGALRANRRR